MHDSCFTRDNTAFFLNKKTQKTLLANNMYSVIKSCTEKLEHP